MLNVSTGNNNDVVLSATVLKYANIKRINSLASIAKRVLYGANTKETSISVLSARVLVYVSIIAEETNVLGVIVSLFVNISGLNMVASNAGVLVSVSIRNEGMFVLNARVPLFANIKRKLGLVGFVAHLVICPNRLAMLFTTD